MKHMRNLVAIALTAAATVAGVSVYEQPAVPSSSSETSIQAGRWNVHSGGRLRNSANKRVGTAGHTPNSR